MGPVLIFDKSALQGLNPDEAVLLDHYFTTNIIPILFVEMLADLEKQVRKGRSPEDVVGSLAYKTPDLRSRPNVHHTAILQAELRGFSRIDVNSWRPVIAHGRRVELEGRTGIVFQPAPEEEAFKRWQRHEFVDLERTLAKAWRRSLSGVNHHQTAAAVAGFLGIAAKCRNLEEVRSRSLETVDSPDTERVLRFGLSLLGVSAEAAQEVLERWVNEGRPSLRNFAPYFRHVTLLDVFFYLAIHAGQLSGERPSHKIDLAYLYYLPFCMVFTSSDRLHKAVVPLFLRSDQSFVSGEDLKADLAALDRHLDSLPPDVKARGLFHLTITPPRDASFLVTRLWDKHASGWRERDPTPMPADGEFSLPSELSGRVRRPSEAARITGQEAQMDREVSPDEADYMMIERSVLPRKGKWTRFPREILAANKERS